MELLFADNNVTNLFKQVYAALDKDGEIVKSRIGNTKHFTDMTLILTNPMANVCLDKTRNLSLKYMLGEIAWYMSGSNKLEDIGKYAKMWYNLSDDGETVNSAYGYRIFEKFGFNQLDYCIEKLKANPYDRQCVIHIKEASNKPTKDTPCTCLLQFTCFKNKLNLHVYMRSNDIWLGLPYDIAFFTCVQQYVAYKTGISLGYYYHTVGDLHLYEQHWGKGIEKTINDAIEPTYNYSWEFTLERIDHTLERHLKGQEPIQKALKELWRINNGK